MNYTEPEINHVLLILLLIIGICISIYYYLNSPSCKSKETKLFDATKAANSSRYSLERSNSLNPILDQIQRASFLGHSSVRLKLTYTNINQLISLGYEVTPNYLESDPNTYYDISWKHKL